MARWLTVDTGPAGVHVYPLDDLVLHLESQSCFCGPRVSWVHAGSIIVCNGQRHQPVQFVRTMTVHEAMDGRE